MKADDSPALDAVMRLFTQDDGSLPELVLSFREADGVRRAVDQLLAMTGVDLTDEIVVWRTDDSGAERMNIGHAARAVCAGEFGPFHIVLGQLNHAGVSIPDLGVFVAPDELTFDYRQGDLWNRENVSALLKWMGSTGGQISAPWWQSIFPVIDAILARLAAGT